MNTTLAPNQQTERSIDIQSVELPAHIPLAAIQSSAVRNLCLIQGGSFVAEISDHLRECVAAAYNLNKASELKITLKFKPGGKNRMEVIPAVSAKVPKEEHASTSLFCTGDGQLLAHDPEQQRLDLRVVKTHDVTARRVIDVDEEAPAPRHVA